MVFRDVVWCDVMWNQDDLLIVHLCARVGNLAQTCLYPFVLHSPPVRVIFANRQYTGMQLTGVTLITLALVISLSDPLLDFMYVSLPCLVLCCVLSLSLRLCLVVTVCQFLFSLYFQHPLSLHGCLSLSL